MKLIPIYLKIKEDLEKEIFEKYKLGDQIATEKELMKKYNVSRPTVSKAINLLIDNGILKSIRGKGTFVKNSKIHQDFTTRIISFNDEMSKKGKNHKTNVLYFKTTYPNAKIAHNLGIGIKDKIYKMVRVRSVDDSPILYVVTTIAVKGNEFIKDYDYVNNSYYDVLEKNGKKIYKVKRILDVKKAPKKITQILNTKPDEKFFYFETVAETKSGEIIEYSECYYITTKNKFRIEIINEE